MQTAGRLLFMAMVTCYLLGRVFAGETTHPETVVYAATAAFGLDFLIASWRSLWTAS
jgi:hypothetical protein